MDLIGMQQLAVALARDAGDFAVREAAAARVEAKGADGDVVTHVDRECEERIAAGILARYPDHALLGEETGERGSARADIRWLIDPLDGTNNYVLGIPYYGVCVTACRGDEPLVAVAHDSPARRTYSAVIGGGALRDGEPVRMAEPGPLRSSTVAWTQGYGVDRNDGRRDRAFATLERGTKRVLRSWCPSVDWGLVASGRLAGMIAYRNAPWDLVGGVLIAREAGAEVVVDDSGDFVVVAHPAVLQELLDMLAVVPASLPG